LKHFVIGLTLLGLLLAGMTSLAYAEQVVELSGQPSGVTMMNQDDMGVTLKMEIGELKFYPVSTKGGDFTLISIEGFSRSFEVGEPNVPVASRILAIPFGCDLDVQVISYDIQEYSLQDLGIKTQLIPVQPSISKSDDPDLIPFEQNVQLYQTAGYYGLPVAQTEILGTMRSVHLGMVSFSPVEYDPVENKIRVYNNIEVRVNFLNPDWELTNEMQRKYYSPYFEQMYQGIINYQAPDLNVKADLTKYPIKMVIVADPAFEAQLQPYIEWKTKKGFIVVEAYTDDIGSSNAAVTGYLEGLYNSANPPSNPAPSFVLFVADDNQIPAYSLSGHISDLPHCEYSTPSDYFPEVYYGRFSAQTPAQLQPQIDKTLEYEMYAMPDPSYLEYVTLIAGVDASHAPTYGNGQINYGTDYYFNAAHGIDPYIWLYPDSDSSGAAADIIATINSGIALINYSAHCGHDGHSDPSFTTSNVASLTNIHKYGLGIGNCCLANTFGDDYSTPCLGEAWMQKVNGGGIGYIGGTNSTYWDEDYWWGVGYGSVSANPTYAGTGPGAYDGIFHDHGEPDSLHYLTNGAIIYAGNMAVTQSNSTRKQYYWEIYHIMGDPSIMTYLGVPTENNVTLPSTVLITDNSVYIEADPYSYVGISRNGVLHGAGYLPTGSGTINIDPFVTPGDMEVVISCQFRQPFIDTVLVIAPDGPYVIYNSHDINDASGNNNGEVEIGESILLGMQLINVGPDTSFNTIAKLSSADIYAAITDSTESFGTINPDNGLAYVADAYAFDVPGNTPDGHKINFDLEVSGDTNRITWNSGFNVTVHAPVIDFVSFDVNDATGNGNGLLEPGESAELTVTLKNTGSADAVNISGVLSEYDTYVSISDANGTFGLLDALTGVGDNAGDVFVIAADGSCPMGYAMEFTLDITADGGFTKTLYFEFTVGDRIAIYYDNFNYDQGWTGMGGNGEWTIGPCVGGTGGSGAGDPNDDHTPNDVPGDNDQVLGNDLTSGTAGGDYEDNLAITYWVYSPIIDCEDYTSIQMTYFHWLGVESSSYDKAYFDVFDGNEWIRLYANGATLDEGAWLSDFYDLSTYADGNELFQLRWGIGKTDGSGSYCGWNIDDIEIKGYYNGQDYKVRLQPEVQSQYGPAGDSSTYFIMVRNRGAFFDQFNLAYAGDWDVAFFNEAGTSQITQTGSVGSLDSAIVMVKVEVPDGTPLHEFDSTFVIVSSQGNPMAKDTALLITYSAGVPAVIPWTEAFPTTSMEMQRWFSNTGATINDDCMNPPSPPYAINLDGGVDTAVTQLMDLTGQTGVMASYYYQRGGGGAPPQADENLWVEYRTLGGDWAVLAEYEGGGAAMEEFEYVQIELPINALHNSFQLRLRSYGSGSGYDDWFVDDICIDYPPAITVTPGMMSETLFHGDSAEHFMVIENTGLGGMFYNIDLTYHMLPGGKFASLLADGMVEPAHREYPAGTINLDLDKDSENEMMGYEVLYKAGGPDDFGYYWMDSDETGGPAFDWVDISSSGTDIIGLLDDDNYAGPYDIGFDFPYYGATYSQFYIGSNGIIGFDATSMNARIPPNIPSAAVPNNILAWLWDDLNPDDADCPGAHVFFESDGNALVIQFVDYPEYRADPGDVINAEVILYEDGTIKYQYLDIASGFDINTCAIGIENSNGTDGLEVCYMTAYVHNNLAVQFSKPYEWLLLNKLAGTVAPGEADTIQCRFVTEEDLEANTYTADIDLYCNDPDNDHMTITAELTVTGEAPYVCGDAEGDGISNVSDAVYIINYVFSGGNAPDPLEAADVNCDGEVNVSDAVSIINYVFAGGNIPCDTTGDGIPDC
jgi:hypothetical protein